MTTIAPTGPADRLEEIFSGAGLQGFLHVTDIDRGTSLSHGGEVLGHSASVGKVPILVAFMRAVAAGEHSLTERVLVPAAGRTPGPTGLSIMSYDVELALRDVAQLMIGMSDNHATDMILQRVPPDRVTATMRELGLSATTIEITIAHMYQQAAERVEGVTDPEEAAELMRTDPQLRPETAPWRTTPEEMTRLLGAIWRDEVAPPELCEEMRTILRSYATTNGLACGFPFDVQMRIAGKTGTTIGVKNEMGVVEYPDGGRYAVAIFTRTPAERWKLHDAHANAAVGSAVSHAVDALHAAS